MSAEAIQSADLRRNESALESTRANFCPIGKFNLFEISFSDSGVGAPEISIWLTVNSEDQPRRYEPAPNIRTVIEIANTDLGGFILLGKRI
jgi:hypothetical protein